MATNAREWLRLGMVIALALLGVAAIIGLATQEMRLSHRNAYGASLVPAALSGATAAAPTAAPDVRRLARVDAAIAQRDASRAIYEWREAYGEALRTRRWEALLAVGDAGARVEVLLGGTGRYRAEARQAYMAALLRARSEGSVAGMRRVADAFAALGDQSAAVHARLMAQRAS